MDVIHNNEGTKQINNMKQQQYKKKIFEIAILKLYIKVLYRYNIYIYICLYVYALHGTTYMDITYKRMY